jgi:TRAP-type C4-dicarboxylate transport system permease small subunit
VGAPGLARSGLLGLAIRGLARVNSLLVAVSMLALLAAAVVLTTGVFLRYFFKVPTDWQDETSVFLMVGCTFLTGAWVQEQRGHVGIEALASVLGPRVDRARRLIADVISLLFCVFFSWKSWTLLHEAIADSQTTSSTWAPPLWIPYSLMAVGMTLVSLQLLMQVITRLAPEGAAS